MEVSIASTRRVLARRPPVVLLAAFAALTFLLVLRFGASATALGLDPSWTEVLGWAFLNEVQFGRDLIFTYGPLGFLQSYAYHVHGIFPWFVAGQIALSAAFSIVVAVLLKRCTLGQCLLFAFAFACWSSQFAGDMCWALTLVFGTVCLVDRDQNMKPTAFYLPSVLLAPFYAVIALAKFSLFPLWALCVAAVACAALLGQGLRRCCTSAAIFVSALLGAWLLAGQQVANLPVYLLRSFQIAAGYGHAMGNHAPFFQEALALLICAALLCACVIGAWHARARRSAGVVPAVVAVATLLIWLSCFTRGDHWKGFFPSIALLPLALIASAPLAMNAGIRRISAAVVLVASASAFAMFQPSVIIAQLTTIPRISLQNLTHLRELGQQRERDLVAVAKASNLPKIRARVGDKRVDMVTWEQGLLIVNAFNYAPRPVFQSYAAFTPELARLNESYYLGPTAPEFVVFKLEVIDGRMPMSEDGLALIALMKRYRPVLSERGFLLLERDDAEHPGALEPRGDAVHSTGRLGANFALGGNAATTVGFFGVKLNTFGKLYTTLFREPELSLTVTTKKGDVRYRLVRPTAASGFLINPVVETNFDWVNLYFSMPPAEVVSMRIDAETKWYRRLFERQFTISFQSLQTLRADPKSVTTQRGALVLYPGFDLAPIEGALRTIVEDGEESVFLHAPATLTFRPTPGRYSASAIYGVQRQALRDSACVKAKPDGIGVGIVVRHGDEDVDVVHAEVDPFRRPLEAGPHTLIAPSFDVAAGDTVEYRVDGGPDGNFACDWSYVRDLVFVRRLLPINAAATQQPGSGKALKAGFNIAPIVAAERYIVDEGKESMFLHAPTSIDFRPAPGHYAISATVGVQSIAVAEPGCLQANPDGVGVSIALRHRGRETMLRHLEIDPFKVPTDRGPHQISVNSVEISNGDILSYRLDPGHGGNNTSCDWTYLRDFRVVPTPSGDSAPRQ